MEIPPDDKFALLAEAEGRAKPLIGIDLPLGRLFDDVVVPYQSDEPFFIDGFPLTREKIKRIKIMKQGGGFSRSMSNFHLGLTRSDAPTRKIYGDQYQTRLEEILLTQTEDVTSQIIKAYDTAIKPSLKDYLPKREELISGAIKVFVESVKLLG